MARKKKDTYADLKNSKFATSHEARIVDAYNRCEKIMKEKGWSWYDESGKPLPPIDMLALIDKVCDELNKEDE